MVYVILFVVLSCLFYFKVLGELISNIINNKKDKIKMSIVKNIVLFIILSLIEYNFMFTDKGEALQVIKSQLVIYSLPLIAYLTKAKNSKSTKENKSLKSILTISGSAVIIVALLQQYLIYSIGYELWIVAISVLILIFITACYYVYKLKKTDLK